MRDCLKNKRMKKYISALLLALAMASSWELFSQVAFTEIATSQEMENARKRAEEGDLLLFVDIYAAWCGPCKVMDRDVYTDQAVAEFMNANFVSVRIDGETDFGRKFASDQGLEGYPSMFIYGPEGEPVSRLLGFKPAGELLASLRGVTENYGMVKAYRSAYEQGAITREAFAEYIRLVREMGNKELAEKLAGEYIRKRANQELSDNDIRVVAFYMDLEDPWWGEFRSDTKRVREVLGDDYLPAMEQIYNNTLVKAVEQEEIRLISRMANELAPLVENVSTPTWDLRSLPFIQYYYYTDQLDELMAYVDRRFAADRKGDHRWLFRAASQIVDMDQQYRTPELMAKGEEWFSACLEYEKQFDYYFYQGMVLLFQQKTGEARVSFENASALADSDEERSMVSQVLSYVNGQ
jgi:thioredoxin-related protein